MKPVDIIRAEGHTNVKLTDNKAGYHLVKFTHKHSGISRYPLGAIFKQTHDGWEKWGQDGLFDIMVTCFYNLTKR